MPVSADLGDVLESFVTKLVASGRYQKRGAARRRARHSKRRDRSGRHHGAQPARRRTSIGAHLSQPRGDPARRAGVKTAAMHPREMIMGMERTSSGAKAQGIFPLSVSVCTTPYSITVPRDVGRGRDSTLFLVDKKQLCTLRLRPVPPNILTDAMARLTVRCALCVFKGGPG